ncbi:MAG: mannose-6-phosphate isomerase, class I, partial [Desulfobacterales bacterium]|nr:mannose-6-phosphate isomerase, class I [Desulfobacterales bacterium]
LAAAEPLSIQAHPGRERARKGFKAENEAGIELNAFNRSYKDDNHKPELICALTPFWALKGFRKIESMIRIFEKIHATALEDELDQLKKSPDRTGLRRFYSALMNLEKEKRESAVRDAVRFASRQAPDEPLWAWTRELDNYYPGDVGVLSPILLNLVQLRPGEALYLPSGELHAYLEGVGVEIMANSDNVLRGGCTPKF